MYLYLDSKIRGTYSIVLSYFQKGILDKSNVTILHKDYRVNRKWKQHLIKNGISLISITSFKDLPSLEGKKVFYMFNAQSNCRMVSYREAIHIFIGHGESNKLASAKPIFRIYDYIAVAGEANIARFIEQNIFTQCDVKNNKFLKVGNRFIEDIGFDYVESSNRILYAPTWEGGIKEENYSSIEESLKSFEFLAKYVKENNIDEIIIQPHPNTGHRNPLYLHYLYKGVKLLRKDAISIKMKRWSSNFIVNLMFREYIVDFTQKLSLKNAFCDISAIEMQLLNNDIPTFIFESKIKNTKPTIQLLQQYYQCKIVDFEKVDLVYDMQLHQQVKQYYIEQNSIDDIL